MLVQPIRKHRMTSMIIRRLGSVAIVVIMAFGLMSSTATDSNAKRTHGAGRHGAAHNRKSAHSARHTRGNRHAKLSHSSAASATLSNSEKTAMIDKIKQLAKSSMITDDSVVAAEASNLNVQSQIAEAAKEERAEDDVDVSIEQFFQARPGSIETQMNPEKVRERQQDYTLFDETDPQVVAQRSDVMAQIINWIGTKYQFGGVGTDGIDCSAFTRAVFQKSFGFELPRTAVMQASLGDVVSKSDLQFGDLVFFRTASYAPITHVGIYIGEGLFANAACSKGVSVASLSSSYWSKHYIGARRLFSNSAVAMQSSLLKQPAMAAEEGTLTNASN